MPRLKCFVKTGLFQHANAPATVAAAGAGYRCSLFKYDAERFADGGTARALRALRLGHCDAQAGEVHALADNGTLCGGSLVRADVGDDENFRQVDGLDCVQRGLCILVACDQRHVRFEALADALVGAGSLQNAVDVRADAQGSLPDGHFGVRQRVVRIRLRHLVQQHVAAVVAVAVRHLEPDLVAGEREDGCKYLRHGIEDDPQRALRRAAGGGIRAVAVQAVLDDIEIEARKRHDAEIVDGVGTGQEFIVLIDRQF